MKTFTLNLAVFISMILNFREISPQTNENTIVYISVNGLVCDFCARSIEKSFNKKPSVNNVDIDLDKMLITVNFKKGEYLNNEVITQLIEDSGYSVVEIRYEN